MHAVTSPKLSIVTKVLVQTASARRHTVDAGGCRSRPILARDRARMRDRASPLQEWATLVARRPRPRPRPLQAEVMRAAWLFRGRKPELNSLQKSCAQRGCSADATPSSTHSVCRPRRRRSQERLSTVRPRVHAPSSCLRAQPRGLVGSWDRGAWSRPHAGRTNAHEGCGARLRRRQSSERPGHDV